MKELLAVYLQSGLFGSIIIVLILLMRCFLKKAPRMILCVLWLLAAARLVLPFNLESQLSLQPSYDPAQLTAHMAIQSEDPAPLPQWTLIAPADPLPQEAPSAPVTAPVSGDAVQPAAALDHMQLLSLIWLVVGGVLVLYAGISYAALRCKVREAVMLDPQVMESERIGGAFLLGYFKPIIYVPVGLDPHDRRFILAHERAHIARGDNWWKLAGYLCCCIHWYNPLVWLGYVLLCRDIEIACDQRVIQDLDLDDRKAYSFALLNCGKRLSGYLAYPVAFGEVSLKQRIKHVLTYRCPSQWVTIIGVVAVVFVSVCFLTSPISDAVSLPINTEPAATESTTLSTTVPAETDFQTEATAATTAPTLPATTPTMPVPTAPHTTTPEKPSPTEPSAPAPTAPPATVPEEVPDSGTGILDSGSWDTWDDSPVTWQVSTDGTLTISGIGTLHGSSDYPWQSYSHLITRVVIDDGITGLPYGAFQNMNRLTSVSLSQSIYCIPLHCFANCTALRTIAVPSGVREIMEYAFYGCTSLTDVRLPESLSYIYEYAFAYTGLTEFVAPSGLLAIYYNAFEGCAGLQKVVLEGKLRTLLVGAFENCSGLRHVVLGQSIDSAGNGFQGCYGIETLDCRSDAALRSFRNCTALRSVVLGGTVSTIGNGVFEGCTALQSVQITSAVTEISLFAFRNCSALTSFTIPDTVTTIGSFAFEGTSISQITIPASVQKMGGNVFQNSGIVQIVFVGDMPTFLNNSTFAGVTATVYYPADNPTWTEAALQNYGGDLTWVPQS